MNVYLHIIDDEVLYYIDEPGVCNCKDCVRIEPNHLTTEAESGNFRGRRGHEPNTESQRRSSSQGPNPTHGRIPT